ncbi:MAG: hypothetical protein RL135_97, partial [Bacteroidota bacterium]
SDDIKCLKPGQEPQIVPFKSLSKTGGIVNAFEAVKIANEYKPMIATKPSTNIKK